MRRRVVVYGMNYAPELTGVGRYTGDIGSYLAKQGVDVEVVTAVPHYPGWRVSYGYRNTYGVERRDGVRVTRCPLMLRAEGRGVWRLLAPLSFALSSAPVVIWRILSRRPDAVFCIEPTLFGAPAALLAARLVGAGTVLHVQDLEVDAAFAVGHLRGVWLQRAAGTVERAILRAFGAIVAISSRMQQRLRDKGVADSRLTLVRNWVDIDAMTAPDIVPLNAQEMDIPPGSLVAVYSGNVGPKQALRVVLDAAERLAAKPGVVFVIAGDGPEKPRLVARYGHLPNVRFLPVQPEGRFRALMRFADVHLLPQDGAVADLVLPSKLGAMLASSKLSIVMAAPGTELFEFLDGGGAIILPPGDSEALAQTIETLALDRAPALACNAGRLAMLESKRNLAAIDTVLSEVRASHRGAEVRAVAADTGGKI